MTHIKRVLFLDFDGVLHYSGNELPFSRTSFLEKIIELDPHLDIIISSSWRESFDLQGLKDFFPDSIAERIQGVTPIFKASLLQNEDGDWVEQNQGIRQKEIEQYMVDNYPLNTSWIALDDAADLFKEDTNLILTPTGMNEETVDAFEYWLKATLGIPVLPLPMINLKK